VTTSFDDVGVEKSGVMRTNHVVKRKADDQGDRDVAAAKRRASPPDIQGVIPPLDRGRQLDGLLGAGSPPVPCRSAFQRVDRASLGPTTPPSPSPAISSSSPSDVAGVATALLPLSVATKPLDVGCTAPPPGLLVFAAERLRAPMILGAAGFVPPTNPAPPETFYGPKIVDEPAYARNFAVASNNNNATGSDVQLLNRSSLGVAGDLSRHGRPSPPPPLSLNGGYRTSNPMMEKLLQLVSAPRPAAASSGPGGGGPALSASFPSLQLAQNWCAKCNTSFRMTSDLVYHMRTQHKGDLDLDPAGQGRRKDANKLRCDVCGETFKERHHLTRHMTSHAA